MDLFPWVSRPSRFASVPQHRPTGRCRKLAHPSLKTGEMLANFQLRVFALLELRAQEEMHGWS